MCRKISYRISFFAIFSLLLPFEGPQAFGQRASRIQNEAEVTKQKPERIRLILIQGNEKTREEIILREMKLRQGQPLNLEELERDRLRIQNLGIFNRVEIDIVPTDAGSILIVSVSEMWYFFPYPIIFRNERSWSRISVGAGLLYNNFRGRREVINFSAWLGFNPAARLSYSNPWIFGQAKLYPSVTIWPQNPQPGFHRAGFCGKRKPVGF